jgi:hypothetical protein
MWMILVGALLLLALGFAAGALTMQAVDTEPAGLAEDSVVALIEDSVTAANAGDEAAIEALFSPDAEVFFIDDGVVLGSYEFPDVIARELAGTTDLALTSEVVQHGDYASVSYTEAETHGLMVVEILNGKIDNQWIFIDEYK